MLKSQQMKLLRNSYRFFLFLLPVLIGIGGMIWWVKQSVSATPLLTPQAEDSVVVSATAEKTIASTATASVLPSAQSISKDSQTDGVMVLSLRDGVNTHLFAYHPLNLALTRISHAPWDDIDPAVSPDGKKVAYSSRQNGYWDLFLLDLETGVTRRLTGTPDYEGAPTWSPDGQWLAYEHSDGIGQDIYLLSLMDEHAQPERLTDWDGVERSPAWSPQGRQVAFVSDKSGDEDVWLADLDQIDHRFTNVSNTPLSNDSFPAWSKDGHRLAWSSETHGDHRITVWDAQREQSVLLNAQGDRPLWSGDGKVIFAEWRAANQLQLTAYDANTGRLSLPPVDLPGSAYGFTWVNAPLPTWLAQTIQQGDQTAPPPLFSATTIAQANPTGRSQLLPLKDVTAPQAMLHAGVIDSFDALRSAVAQETGWDAFSSLENAFVPLTATNDPALDQDWLATGRAFTLNPLYLSAGWMTVAREELGGQTYWRVYLRARYQDGSMGLPIREMTWDLNVRYSGNTRAYEQGGKQTAPPDGYWINLTELASRYGWERLPALIPWRTNYLAIRANEFARTDGLDWQSAMTQLYPPEALMTATPHPTKLPTETMIPKTPFPAATRTPSAMPVPQRRATLTPPPNMQP